MDFLDKLGIDWKLFGAQLVNFVVLLFVLYRFLYKPVLAILEKRRKEIENNAATTKKLETRLATTEKETKELLQQAEKEAQNIIHESRDAALALKADLVKDAQDEAKRIVEEARRQIVKERDLALEDVMREGESLLKQALLKILGEVMDKHVGQALEKKALDAVGRITSKGTN